MCGILGVISSNGRSVVGDLGNGTHFLQHRGPAYAGLFVFDPVQRSASLEKGEGLADNLRALVERLREVEPWECESLEQTLRDVAAERGVGAGKLIHPTRLAVTGMGVGPGIFDVLRAVGRERALARLERLVQHVDSRADS